MVGRWRLCCSHAAIGITTTQRSRGTSRSIGNVISANFISAVPLGDENSTFPVRISRYNTDGGVPQERVENNHGAVQPQGRLRPLDPVVSAPQAGGKLRPRD